MNLLTSYAFHDFHPLILKHLHSFKPHREVVFLTNTKPTGNLPRKCVLCWFPDPRDVLINAESSLILGSASPTSELRGQLSPPIRSFSHREPRPMSANHQDYLTYPFGKMADATNPARSIPSELSFWHAEKLDAWQRKSMCSSQPSRKRNQTAAEGPFVLLGVKIRGSLLSTSKTHQRH